MYWPGDYETFYLLNSTEHQISTAHKTKMLKNKDIARFQAPRCCNCWHVNIYEHDIFHAQLSLIMKAYTMNPDQTAPKGAV